MSRSFQEDKLKELRARYQSAFERLVEAARQSQSTQDPSTNGGGLLSRSCSVQEAFNRYRDSRDKLTEFMISQKRSTRRRCLAVARACM